MPVKVIQVQVSVRGAVTNSGQFPSMSDANEWVNKNRPTFDAQAVITMNDITQAYYANLVRQRRNELLSACDWVVASDNRIPLLKKPAWLSYRQALRDLPQNTNDFTNVTWPTPPT